MSFSALQQREIPATAFPPEANVSELQGRSEAQEDGENVHAEGGVSVAVSRGLTLDSPGKLWRPTSKLILAQAMEFSNDATKKSYANRTQG